MHKKPKVWHEVARARSENVLELFNRDCAKLAKEQADDEMRRVLFCFLSDPYQPLEGELHLTRRAIAIAARYGIKIDILTKGDDSLIIKAGNIRSSIKTMPIDGFPENFTLSEATEATIDFDDLVEMLSSVVYATATSEARPIHTGVLLDGDGTDLNVVACDGFRCAWAHAEYPESFKMVIPKPTVKLLLSIKQEGKLKISMQGEKAVFEIGDCKIYARLLSGSFLDYRRVFPSRTKSIGVDRGKLLGAMNRIMICSDDTHKGKVELDGTDTSLQVKCTSSSADYIEELEVQDKFPADLRIMFNSAYVVDALKSYDCSVIDCFFGDKSTEPLVMDDGALKSLILPVRIVEGTKGAAKA